MAQTLFVAALLIALIFSYCRASPTEMRQYGRIRKICLEEKQCLPDDEMREKIENLADKRCMDYINECKEKKSAWSSENLWNSCQKPVAEIIEPCMKCILEKIEALSGRKQ
ncbi:uncharacterized protein LOC120330198 [Styela clava]